MSKGKKVVSAIVGTVGETVRKDPRLLLGGKPMSRYGVKRRGYDPKSLPKITSLQATGPLIFAKTGS